MDLSNALILAAELFSSLVTVVLLLAGAKVWGLLAAQLCGSLFILVGGIGISRRLLPSVTVSYTHLDVYKRQWWA